MRVEKLTGCRAQRGVLWGRAGSLLEHASLLNGSAEVAQQGRRGVRGRDLPVKIDIRALRHEPHAGEQFALPGVTEGTGGGRQLTRNRQGDGRRQLGVLDSQVADQSLDAVHVSGACDRLQR